MKGWNIEVNGEERSRTVPVEDIESFEELVSLLFVVNVALSRSKST
jgi:hypothetical protein